ncbi:MAG: amidohydrolase family protein, partial [Chlamydiia bacterium]|nr:amidohydrolase family protein [Chlamydiia bacterium]
HSSADSACVDAAVDAGAVLCTHLFNAMPGLHHRELSIVGKALAERCLSNSMIVDGVHVDPGVVALSYPAHPEGMILVTDAMAAMGLDEGSYCLGSMEVEVANGRAVIAGTQTLAGSVLRMDDAVRNLWVFSGCSKVEALEAASLRPAQLLSLDEERGDLGIGKRADFVVLSQDLQLESTYYQGVEVYSADTGLLSACKET